MCAQLQDGSLEGEANGMMSSNVISHVIFTQQKTRATRVDGPSLVVILNSKQEERKPHRNSNKIF